MSLASPAGDDRPNPLRVLIVDDEVPVRKVAQRMIQALGNQAEIAANITEAEQVADAASEGFDLALVDMRLGAESGLDLARRLRARWPDLTVVGMGGDLAGEAQAARREGVLNGLLAKPFALDDLRKALALAAAKPAAGEGPAHG